MYFIKSAVFELVWRSHYYPCSGQTWEARKNHGDNCATSDENKQIHYLQKHFNKPKNKTYIFHADHWSVNKHDTNNKIPRKKDEYIYKMLL